MEIWLSGEVQGDVSEGLRQARAEIKRAINPNLTSDYGPSITEWALISIVRPRIPDGWGEVHVYHPERKVAEFRLIIDYNAFKNATDEGRVHLLLDSLLRSLDIFPLLKVNGFDLDRFRQDIVRVARSKGWMIQTPIVEND